MKLTLFPPFVFFLLTLPSYHTNAGPGFSPTLEIVERAKEKTFDIYAEWKGFHCENLTNKDLQTVTKALGTENTCPSVNEIKLFDDVYFNEQAKSYKNMIACELKKNDCIMTDSKLSSFTDTLVNFDLKYQVLFNKWLRNKELNAEEKRRLDHINSYVSDEDLKKVVGDSCAHQRALAKQLPDSRFARSEGDCSSSVKTFLKFEILSRYGGFYQDDLRELTDANILSLVQKADSLSACDLVKEVKSSTKELYSARRHHLEKEQNWLADSCDRTESDSSKCFYRPNTSQKALLIEFGGHLLPLEGDAKERESYRRYMCHLEKTYLTGRNELKNDTEKVIIPAISLYAGGLVLKAIKIPAKAFFSIMDESTKVRTALVASHIVKKTKQPRFVRSVEKGSQLVSSGVIKTSALAGFAVTGKTIADGCMNYVSKIRKKMGKANECQCEYFEMPDVSFQDGDCSLEISRLVVKRTLKEAARFAAPVMQGMVLAEQTKEKDQQDAFNKLYEQLLVENFSRQKEKIALWQDPEGASKLEKFISKYQEGRTLQCH